jgi:hypothetical protein
VELEPTTSGLSEVQPAAVIRSEAAKMSCVFVMPVSLGGLVASIESMPGTTPVQSVSAGDPGDAGQSTWLRPYVATGSAGHRYRGASAANFGTPAEARRPSRSSMLMAGAE